MAQVIFRQDNGEEIVIRDNLPDNYDCFQVLFRDDYFATKLWCAEDIKCLLTEKGFKGTDEEVSEVLNQTALKALGDCTDSDWDIIDWAIMDAGFDSDD